jgi:predicted O-linked N-acetylglucosamine transferase (SPINDLY family)
MTVSVSNRQAQIVREGLNLARMLWRAKRQDQAIAEAQRWAQESDSIEPKILLAEFFITQENWPAADHWLTLAEQQSPDQIVVADCRLRYLARKGEQTKALEIATVRILEDRLAPHPASVATLIHDTAVEFSPALLSLFDAVDRVFAHELSLQKLVVLTALSHLQFEAAYRAALRLMVLEPDNAENSTFLAFSLMGRQRTDEAIELFAVFMERFPDEKKLAFGYGCALSLASRFQTSLEAFNTLVLRYPDYADAWVQKGLVEVALKEYDQATLSIKRGLEIDPDVPEGQTNLAYVWIRQNRIGDAEMLLQSMAGDPVKRTTTLLSNLGHIYQNSARQDLAVATYQQALALKPDDLSIWGGVVMAADYAADITEAEVFSLHRCYGKVLEKLNPPASPVILSPRQPLTRIGLVSGDFNNHACARFALPLVELLGLFDIEVVLISTTVQDDHITKAYRELCYDWVDAREMSNSDLVDAIRHRGISFLVDLAGHTAYNRLPVFARQAAPVQMSWLGYPNTTGLKGIGYRMTDHWADPVGMTEKFYTEKLVRLDRCFLAYQTVDDQYLPDAAKNISDQSHLNDDQPIVFGSLNNLAKLTPACCQLWARVMQEVPESRLRIKRDPIGDSMVKGRYEAIFADFGIDPSRLDLRGHGASKDHLKTYQEIDIALDCFPYNGTTTTCEALTTGVPVVVLAGQTHRARVGVSLMNAIDRPEWIAQNDEEYIAICTNMARNKQQLRLGRAERASSVKTTSLFDTSDFASHFWQAALSIWREACRD